ncbi:MAG: AlwI family type II restriction endonuclease, partial [Clostridia bacterium]|nr:AlwI family type II restriction endonuclease [Clostridia bacterium]
FDENNVARPYIVLAYLLQELGELSKEEFTYLLPLTTSADKTKQMVQNIKDIRGGKKSIDDVIVHLLIVPIKEEWKWSLFQDIWAIICFLTMKKLIVFSLLLIFISTLLQILEEENLCLIILLMEQTVSMG